MKKTKRLKKFVVWLHNKTDQRDDEWVVVWGRTPHAVMKKDIEFDVTRFYRGYTLTAAEFRKKMGIGAMSNVEEVRCNKCRRPYKEHIEGKCLFEASTFEGHEELRLALAKDINSEALRSGRIDLERERLEQKWGEVWDTMQVQKVFKIHGFLAPFVGVTRLADGAKGSLTFQHLPRYFFGFMPET